MINNYSNFQKENIIKGIKKRLFLPHLQKLNYKQLKEHHPNDLKDALEYISSIHDLPYEDIKEIFKNN